MREALAERFDVNVNHKRVRRLMKKLGLQAVYPRPRRNTSNPRVEHIKYPYLLRNIEITEPDQVWCADITYLRLGRGFAYLVAIMDWKTRCVLSWELSNSLDSSFCVAALEQALSQGRKPEIFNTDQGCQFTSEAFTSVLKNAGISISMDGAGRAVDNIMVERLWRTVKYEEVYVREYRTVIESRASLERYFIYYNYQRRHSSLERRTPAKAYGKNPSIFELKVLAETKENLRIKVGVGVPSTTNAVAPATLRSASATAFSPINLQTLPPYLSKVSVQTEGTG
jgi:putative transposase